MKIFYKFLFLFMVIFAVKFCFASDDCENAKRAILNDCDVIEAYCDNATNKLRSAVVALRNATVATSYYYNSSSTIPTVNYGSLNDTYLYDSSGSALGVTVGYYVSEVDRALASVSSTYPKIQDIRNRVNSIQCSGSNTCNCAEYLNAIKVEVVVLQSQVDQLNNYVMNIENLFNQLMEYLPEQFDNIFEYQNFMSSHITNVLANAQFGGTTVKNLISHWYMRSSGQMGNMAILQPHVGVFANDTVYSQTDLLTALRAYLWQDYGQQSSLNNFFHSNVLSQASIYKSSISNNVALGTISRDLDRGFDAVTNQFSIFIGASSGASPVLGAYTENDGSYHNYLTNYYIKVSGSSVSVSTPLTNWFNRIEMLLAALVFRDDDGPNTNSIPSSSSFDSLKSELNQNMTSINQQGQDYLTTVETSGQSLISMLREWNGAVSGVAKPSAFVIASIPVSSYAPSSRSGDSSIDITLDTDNESLSGFIELVRGVTTLAWVTLFLVVGYFLSIRIITLIGKLISFGYSVYSAVFGGG